MPWNNNGSGPWGSPGGSNGDKRGSDDRNGQRPPDRPPGPWGIPGGGQRPPGRPPGRPTGRPGGIPDLDEALAGLTGILRRFLPGGGGGGPGGSGSGGGGGGWRHGGRGAALLAVLAIAIWLATGFYRVQPDEQGVVLRFGALSRTTGPGLNYHIPWPVESVLLPAVTRINRTEIGYRSGGPDPRMTSRDLPSGDVPEESLMLTGDENIVDIDFAVFWRIRDAGAFLFNTRNPASTVKAAAESMMREVIGRTPIQPALTEARASIESDVLHGTQAILDQYGSGVEVTQVQLQKVDPPAAVIDSFRDVQRATTEAEQMRNQAEGYRNDVVPRARGDAAQITAGADAQRQSAIAEATGSAQRFLSVLSAYDAAKEITLRRIYIETMQAILQHTPTTIVDDALKGVVPFLPLNTPARPATEKSTGTSSGSPPGSSTGSSPGNDAGKGAAQ